MFVYVIIPFIGVNAQSQIVSQLSEAVIDLTGSFMDNPNHHSNTLKIYNSTEECKKVLDDMYRQVPPSAEADYYMISNMERLIKCLNFIVANIAGYSRGGFDSNEIETTLNPLLDKFGWTWKILNSTEDVIFYEYSKDGFKMVLAKNILPKKEYGDYNAVAFACDSWDSRLKRATSGTRRVVFGGNYQFVTFGDDENKYDKITKVASKRGTSFDSFK